MSLSSGLKLETVSTYESARRLNPEEEHRHLHSRGNFKSHEISSVITARFNSDSLFNSDRELFKLMATRACVCTKNSTLCKLLKDVILPVDPSHVCNLIR
jgi:hypothetical protein